MVRFLILDEQKSGYLHTIIRLGLYKEDAFLQELRYWIETKEHTQTTWNISVESAKRVMERSSEDCPHYDECSESVIENMEPMVNEGYD